MTAIGVVSHFFGQFLRFRQGGGTMFCSRNQWKATKFPRDKFHDSNSKAGGVLMHSKVREQFLS